MFPLTEGALGVVSFGLIFLPVALPLTVYKRLAAIVCAGVLFWFLVWRTGPTSGELYGLYYIAAFAMFLIVCGVAWLWSLVIKRLAKRSLALAIVSLFAPPVLLSGWAILQQTVPASCQETGIAVRIQGETLTLPFKEGRWFRFDTDGRLQDYARRTLKAETRQLCRMVARSGPIDVISLRTGDRYGATEFSIEPADAAKPDWDWNDFERRSPYEIGTAQSGAECYIREVWLENDRQQRAYCAAWQTVNSDLRAVAVNAPSPSRALPESAQALRNDLESWLRAVRIPVF